MRYVEEGRIDDGQVSLDAATCALESVNVSVLLELLECFVCAGCVHVRFVVLVVILAASLATAS